MVLGCGALFACPSRHVEPVKRVGPQKSAGCPATSSPDTGLIGIDAPTVFIAADPEARWVVYCQALSDSDHDGAIDVWFGEEGESIGDDLTLLLTLGRGQGTEIAAYWGKDPTGRYLVVEHAPSDSAAHQDQRLLLIDAQTGSRIDLGARGARKYEHPLASPVSFDKAGHLLYHRVGDDGVVFVVRELASDRERQIKSDSSRVAWADLTEAGNWILFGSLEEDTDGNGILEPPVADTNLAPARCRGPVLGYVVRGYSGDRPVHRALPVTGTGASYRIPHPPTDIGDTPLIELGDTLLITESGGGYALLGQDLRETEIVPRSCDGLVIAAHADSKHLLVECTTSDESERAHIVGPDLDKDLGFPAGGRQWDPVILRGDDRLFPVGTLGPYRVIDLVAARTSPACTRFELRAGAVVPTCEPRDKLPVCGSERPRLCTEDDVPVVLAVSRDGRRLVPTSIRDSDSLQPRPVGPLCWITPKSQSPRPEAGPIPLPSCSESSAVLCVVTYHLGVLDGEIWAHADGTIWVLAGSLYRFDGTRWSIAPPGSPNAMAGADPRRLWLAVPEDPAWNGSKIYAWDGSGWRIQHKAPHDIDAMYAYSTSSAWAVGGDGMVLHWDGRRWRSIKSPDFRRLHDVFSASSSSAWVIQNDIFGDGPPKLFHWNGQSWTQPSSVPHAGDEVRLWGCADSDLWASTTTWIPKAVGRLLHWNGSSWKVAKEFDGLTVEGIHGSSCDNVWAVVAPPEPDRGQLDKNAQLWRWDGGAWSRVSEIPTGAEIFATPTAVWINGHNALLRLPVAPAP